MVSLYNAWVNFEKVVSSFMCSWTCEKKQMNRFSITNRFMSYLGPVKLHVCFFVCFPKTTAFCSKNWFVLPRQMEAGSSSSSAYLSSPLNIVFPWCKPVELNKTKKMSIDNCSHPWRRKLKFSILLLIIINTLSFHRVITLRCRCILI